MNFVEQRAYIKGRTALNQTATSIHAELILIHGESAYKFRSVCKWVECFKAGRDEIEDKPRSGRPITELTEANITLVEQLIDNDKRISYSDLEELTSLSRGTLERIIIEKLCLKKNDHLDGFLINYPLKISKKDLTLPKQCSISLSDQMV